MSPFIETLKRMYVAKKILLIKIDKMFEDNNITKEEYDYIVSQQGSAQ